MNLINLDVLSRCRASAPPRRPGFRLHGLGFRLDSRDSTSHSGHVTHVIRYLKRTEQKYSTIVATRSWARDEA